MIPCNPAGKGQVQTKNPKKVKTWRFRQDHYTTMTTLAEQDDCWLTFMPQGASVYCMFRKELYCVSAHCECKIVRGLFVILNSQQISHTLDWSLEPSYQHKSAVQTQAGMVGTGCLTRRWWRSRMRQQTQTPFIRKLWKNWSINRSFSQNFICVRDRWYNVFNSVGVSYSRCHKHFELCPPD